MATKTVTKKTRTRRPKTPAPPSIVGFRPTSFMHEWLGVMTDNLGLDSRGALVKVATVLGLIGFDFNHLRVLQTLASLGYGTEGINDDPAARSDRLALTALRARGHIVEAEEKRGGPLTTGETLAVLQALAEDLEVAQLKKVLRAAVDRSRKKGKA